MKKLFLISLYFLFSGILQVSLENPVYSQTKPSDKVQYLYPANKEVIFDETVDEFYQALRDLKYPLHLEIYSNSYKMNKDEYAELTNYLFKYYPNASVNFRKKVLFHEVAKFNYITWHGDDLLIPFPDIRTTNVVSPDRQVYFFLSFKETEKDFRGRCAIYDVETKQMVGGAGMYFNKVKNE